MDISQWLQVIGVVTPVQDSTRPCPMQADYDFETSTTRGGQKGHYHAAPVLSCPRCKSTNTKFCYFNNYSVAQPRYLCKGCKRYWTEGGHLRNVPVGGGSRKVKTKPSSSSSSSSSSSKKVVSKLSQPKIISSDQTLYLNFNNSDSGYDGMSDFEDTPFGINFENSANPHSPNLCSSTFSHDIPDCSMPVNYESNSVFSSSSFDNHVDYDIKPSLSYSMDGVEHCFGMAAVQENAASSPRIMFPFEELRPMSPSDYQFEREFSQGESNGCWNGGMMYDGSW